MTYAVSGALQTAIFGTLSSDMRLAEAIGAALYDATPSGTVPDIYVVLGEEEVRDRSDKTGDGSWHDLTISVVTEVASFRRAKEVAGLIADILEGSKPKMTRGRVVGLWFLRARARRTGKGDRRQIDLRYRVQVEDTINSEAE